MSKRPMVEAVEVRGVIVPLRRPVVSKVGQFAEWPLLLIDARTSDGVVGRAYLEPYLSQSLHYIAQRCAISRPVASDGSSTR